MRIVAGSAKGRTLEGPKNHKTIRPTADRVRETIFNILGQWLEGITVLDLYAGTGALGLEAVSRGAIKLVMVDQDREALTLCRENAAHLGFADRATIVPLAVGKALLQLRGQKFDLIFADPPYAARVVQDCLEQLRDGDVLGAEGTFVIEHDKREDAPESHAGFSRIDQRKFGDTMVSFYKRS